MQKKGRVLVLSFLIWCLTAPMTVWATVSCAGDSTFNNTLKDWSGSEGMCWFCPVFEILFKAINNLVTTMSKYMADMFLTLMGLGILFLLAFKIGRMVIQLQEVDLMQFLGDLFKPLGRAIIATALLAAMTFNGDTIYNLLIQPIFDLSLFLSEQVLNTTVSGIEVYSATQSTGGNADLLMTSCRYQGVIPPNTAFTSLELTQLICWMRTVSSSLGVGIAVGSTFIKVWIFEDFWDNMHLALPGIMIFLAFFSCYVVFPLKLLDGIVRFAFVLTLMPLWIILWVFPATAQYTKKAWDMFLNCCVLFIALGVIVSMVIIIMNEAIQPSDIREQLFAELSCGVTDKAVQNVEAGGRALFIILAMGLMSWSLLGTAASLANMFADGGGDLGIEKSVGGNAVKGAAFGYNATKTTARVGAATIVGGSKLGAKGISAGINWVAGKFGEKKDGTNQGATPTSQAVSSDKESTPNSEATSNQSDVKDMGGIQNTTDSSVNNSTSKDNNPASSKESSTYSQDRVPNDISGLNQINQTAQRLEGSVGQKEAAAYREKAINDFISQSPNAKTPEDKSVLRTIADRMFKGGMSSDQARQSLMNHINDRIRAEQAGRQAGESAGSSAGTTSGREAGRQSAQDEISKHLK